jgi:hypothetical protein
VLKVTTEIHPLGNEDEKEIIRELYIANMQTKSRRGATLYNVWLKDPRKYLKHPPKFCSVWHHRENGDLKLVSIASERVRLILEKKVPFKALDRIAAMERKD